MRYYNACRHSKGPMGGIGFCVKKFVFRDVLSEKYVIQSLNDFAKFADSNIKVYFSLKYDSFEKHQLSRRIKQK